MAKGRVYELVDAEGCRVVHVPLSVWPAFTGIITDNQYQFDPDCYNVLVKEVVNVGCVCLPDSISYDNYMTFSTSGLKTIDMLHCQPGEKRRLGTFGFTQVSSGVAYVQMFAVKGTDVCTIGFKGNIPTTVPQTFETDVWLVEDDFIRMEVTVTASSGTLYWEAWGELWTI